MFFLLSNASDFCMALSVKKQDKFFKFGDFCTLGKNSIRSFPSSLRGRKEEEEAGLCWGYGSISTTHRRRRRTKDFAENKEEKRIFALAASSSSSLCSSSLSRL